MGDHAHLEQRIDALRARARAGTDASLLSEMENTLSEGYALALADEGRLRQLDRRLEALFEAMDPADARQIRQVASERSELGNRVRRLRARLAGMHEDFHAVQRSSVST